MQQSKKIIVGVLGLPVRKNGKGYEFFLTQRFAPKKPHIHLKWQLAGGGMEFGESPEETLVREFQEELCVTPRILYPNPIVIASTWYRDNAGHGSDTHVVLLSYIVEIGDQIPKNTDPDHETGEMRWFTTEEIKNLEYFPNTLDVIRSALKLIDKSPEVLL